MKNFITTTISWLFAVLTSFVFLNSLRYKFDETALEPMHIFNTIGDWMMNTLGKTAGDLFADYGQYLIGGAELLTAFILLLPIILLKHRAKLHCIGAIMAAGTMAGAIFFHLFTPLGWHPTWAVANSQECQGLFNAANSTCADTGLANAAVIIFVLAVITFLLNRKA